MGARFYGNWDNANPFINEGAQAISMRYVLTKRNQLLFSPNYVFISGNII